MAVNVNATDNDRDRRHGKKDDGTYHGSHWHNVMVLLEPVEVEAGAQLLVRTTAELGAGAPPRYTFETWLGGAGDEAAPDEMRWLGAATYP